MVGTPAAGEYAAAVEEVAEAGDGGGAVRCLNLWRALQAAAPDDGWHAYLSDGLHLSVAGNGKVFELLVAAVATHWPEIAVTPDAFTGECGNSGSRSGGALHHHGPWHDEIDPADHAAAALSPRE